VKVADRNKLIIARTNGTSGELSPSKNKRWTLYEISRADDIKVAMSTCLDILKKAKKVPTKFPKFKDMPSRGKQDTLRKEAPREEEEEFKITVEDVQKDTTAAMKTIEQKALYELGTRNFKQSKPWELAKTIVELRKVRSLDEQEGNEENPNLGDVLKTMRKERLLRAKAGEEVILEDNFPRPDREVLREEMELAKKEEEELK